MKKILYLIAILLFSLNTIGQKTIDEIEIKLKNTTDDEERVSLLTSAGLKYLEDGDSITARKYANEAMELAKEVGSSISLGSVYYFLGKLYYYENYNGYAIKSYTKAIDYFKEAESKEALVHAYNGLSNSYRVLLDFEKSIDNIMRVISISESLGNEKSIATAYSSLAQLYVLQQNYVQALQSYEKALAIFQNLDKKHDVAVITDKIGEILMLQSQMINNVEASQKKLDNAIEYFKKCLSISTEINYEKGIALAYQKLGRVQYLKGNLVEAMINYHEAMNLYSQINDPIGLAHIYAYNGELFYQLEEYDKSLSHLEDSYRLLTEGKIDAPNLLVQVCKNLSDVFATTEQYKDALTFMHEYKRYSDTLRNNENIKKITNIQSKYQLERQAEAHDAAMFRQRIFTWFATIAFVLMVALAFVIFRGFKIKQRDNKLLAEQKEELLQQKEEILTTTEQLEISNKELEKLSVVASKTDNAVTIMDEEGNYLWVNDGYTYVHGYTLEQLKDEVGTNIINSNTPPDITDEIIRCRENKETVIYEMNTKSRMGKDIWLQTTLTPIINDSGKVKTLIAVESDITKIKEVEKEIKIQRDTLKKTNQRINSSIRYALTIQKAILPLKSTLEQHFETFIYYLPKDIVSGDFYWYSALKGNNEPDKIFVAAVDCTGHGVPGAFMSMIGSRLLNEIVNEKGVTDPGTILDLLNEGIHRALQQEKTDNNDGMDLCICRYEVVSENQRSLAFAGAERPLFLLRNDGEMEIIQGDPKSIGGILSIRDTTPFSTKEVDIKIGDTIYLTSDGLIDQNNSERFRFGTQRFATLMQKNRTLNMEKQKEVLSTEFDSHKKEEEQRDDITVLGLRIK